MRKYIDWRDRKTPVNYKLTTISRMLLWQTVDFMLKKEEV